MSDTKALKKLVETVQALSLARDMRTIGDIVRVAARQLTGADGATFVLREGEQVFYADEDAIAPLWKGKRFPMQACISGWSIQHREHVAIEDIYKDSRIPHDAYRPTFVKSLLMVPVRKIDPIAAIGNYWASQHLATEDEISVLQALADCTSVAIENVRLFDDLKRQVELRDEFVSVTAHELRTPVTPLQIKIQLVDRLLHGGEFAGHPREKELRELTNMANAQLRHITYLIENLLTTSQLRLGAFALNRTPGVDLTARINEVVNRLKKTSRSTIEARLQERVIGNADGDAFELIGHNLLLNAIRYGQDKPITVSLSADAGHASLVVEDSGMGIEPNDQERIFATFERAVSKRHFGGIGLGLFLVRQLTQAHGGTVELISAPDRGARFHVKLPIQ